MASKKPAFEAAAPAADKKKALETALQQIEKMRYAEPFAADARRLFKIGVNFDSESRMLTEWKAVEQKSE